MRIAIASDHAGYRLKTVLSRWLAEDEGDAVIDFGTDSEQPVDYPPFCAAGARAVVDGEADVGIVIGGSGQGEAIAANKVHGARAALCLDEHTARLARRHNDANVLSLGGRIVADALAQSIVEIFLATEFEAAATSPGSTRSPPSNERSVTTGPRSSVASDAEPRRTARPYGRRPPAHRQLRRSGQVPRRQRGRLPGHP